MFSFLDLICQGAILEEVQKEGESLKIKGSVVLALAESSEAVLKDLKEDVYYTSGVWNWEKVQIYPVRAFQTVNTCTTDTSNVQIRLSATAWNKLALRPMIITCHQESNCFFRRAFSSQSLTLDCV